MPREVVKEVKKVAWIRVGALGDLLVGLASFAETLERYPQADAYIVGNSLWKEIIEPGFFPKLRGIFVVDGKSTFGQLYVSKDGQWQPQGELQWLLGFFKGFDAAVNTRIDSLRFAWPMLLAGVRQRVGSASWPFSYLYSDIAIWRGKDPLIHERDAALRLLDPNKSAKANMSLAQEVESSSLIQKWKSKGGLPATKNFDISRAENLAQMGWKKYILINPTASKKEKAWGRERFKKLVEMILPFATVKGFKVLVIGSPKETEWLKFVAGEKVIIIQPKDINELIDVVAGAYLLVANTSSMQFIAASTNTTAITLMGRARPEIWGPLGAHDRFIRGVVTFKEKTLPADEQEVVAFKSIGVDDVLRVVTQCL